MRRRSEANKEVDQVEALEKINDLGKEPEEQVVIQVEDQSIIQWYLFNETQISNILEREFSELDQTQLKSIATMLEKMETTKLVISPINELYLTNWIAPVFATESNKEYISTIPKINYKTNNVILPGNIYLSGFYYIPKTNNNTVLYLPTTISYNPFALSAGNINYSSSIFPKYSSPIYWNDIENMYTYYKIFYNTFIHINVSLVENVVLRTYEYYQNILLIQQFNNKQYPFDRKLESIYGPWYLVGTLEDNYIGFLNYLGNYKLYYYSDDLEKLKKKLTLISQVNYKIKNKIKLDAQRAIKHNYYNYAVYVQLGPTIFNKYIAGMYLTVRQKDLVEKYLFKQKETLLRYQNNKCGHIPIRTAYNSEKNLRKKHELIMELMEKFGKNGVDPETRYIFCSTCGFNIACEHEIVSPDKLKEYEIQNGITIECRYCQRTIATDALVQEPEFTEEGQKIIGTIIDTNDELLYLQNIINNVLRYVRSSGRIRMTTILDYTYGIINTKFNEIESREFVQVREELIKKIIALSYIYGYLVNQDNYDIKIFRDLDNKAKRKVFYEQLQLNDPRFIKELEQTNNLKLFVNTMSKAEKYFEKNIIRNIEKIANKLYNYKFKFNQLPKGLSLIQMIVNNEKFMLSMYGNYPIRWELKRYPNIIIKNNIKDKLSGFTEFDKEIYDLLSIICFGRSGNIKFGSIEINCKNIDSKTITRVRELYLKPSKYQKIEESLKIDNKIQKLEDNKLNDKIIKYFGDRYTLLQDLYNHLNEKELIERKNIIIRFIKYYRQIHFGILSSEVDGHFIEKYDRNYFKIDLQRIPGKPLSYYIEEIITNENVADFILEFVNHVNYSLGIAEYTHSQVESIEDKIREEIRKNYELYGKLTPDEKINYQFSKNFADKFAKVAEIRKQQEEELQNEYEENDWIPKRAQDESYDDIRSYEDDEIYFGDELEYFGKESENYSEGME